MANLHGSASAIPSLSADDLVLIADRLFTGEEMLQSQAVILRGGRVLAYAPADSHFGAARCRRLPPQTLLAPGFIDTQVNGGGGVLFNDQPTLDGIRAIAAAHARFGTTGLLVTLISDDRAVLRQALAAVAEAIRAGTVPGVLGLHLEGPFVTPAKRGVHRAEAITALTDADLDLLTQPFPGKLMVTLAPEQVGPAAIRRLTAAGVIVSAGHSDADYDTARAGFAAGITGVTHLFNAMSQLGSRAPGLVGAALDSDAHCGIIVDGHHVHPTALRLAIAAKGVDRIMLVSDAMPDIGTDLTEFSLCGQRVLVRDGRLTTEAGTLAGASLTMAQAVHNATTLLGTARADALIMAARTPAAFLGLWATHGRLLPGMRADLVALAPDGTAVGVWIDGNAVQ